MRIIVFMFILGSCGGVPEQVDKKIKPSAQTKSLGGSVDKGAKDISKTTIYKMPAEGKMDISKLVEKGHAPTIRNPDNHSKLKPMSLVDSFAMI